MKKLIAGMLAVTVMAVAGMVHAAQVPPLINFQSVLYDDAGAAIPDGASDVSFSITDVNGDVLYQETQTLDVVHGLVAAMVGNGLTSNGSPTGGIPLDVFETDGGRYLEVNVDGYQPQATMEIVSVPYALYATKALGAVENSIDGNAIQPGAITAEHFSSDALQELGGALVTSGGMVSNDSLKQVTAAETIGVRPGFSYSGSSNIQGVLTDLDRIMATRNAQMDTKVTNLQQQITNEATARTSGDSGLQSQINSSSTRITNVEGHVTNVENRVTVVENNINVFNGFFNGGKICAWGHANFESGGGSSNTELLYGSGASVSVASTNKALVTFDESCSDGRYMVLINGVHTFNHNGTPDVHPAQVRNRIAGSFEVIDLNSLSTFDFLVIGEQ